MRRAAALRAACCAVCISIPIRTAQAQDVSAISLPEAETRTDAVYPAEAVERQEEGTSVLFVTIESDGNVSHVEVAESAGEAFDAAAIAAVRQWHFRPAQRAGTPIRVRIRVPFRFKLPVVEAPAPEAAPGAAVSPPAEGSDALATTDLPRVPAPAPPMGQVPRAGQRRRRHERETAQRPVDVTIVGRRQLPTEARSASDFAVKRDVLQAAPRQEGAEVLRAAPGLYIARAEGLAVGHRYMLRGFDADHGQDIEIRVGGVPINLPSHVHGQGYADLGFLIAEVIDEVHASEGVYDPRQGDFAVAGTLDIGLGVERRGIKLQSSYGAFDTARQLLLWAPPDRDRGSFGAVQYSRTDGFGQNRSGHAASAILQSVFEVGAWSYRALAILHGARSDLAGVVRADDVDAGRVGFYDVYPYATARAQNAFAARIVTAAFGEYRGPNGDDADVGVWAGLDDLRLQENFTGFNQRSRTLENVAGRGDLIEQQNRTKSVGFSGRYRTAPYRPARGIQGSAELGLAGRIDDVDQAQNLLDATVRNQTWDRHVDASIVGADLGFWGDLDWRFTRYLRLHLGLRADALYYDVNDRLGNFAPLTRPDDRFIVGFRRSAFGLAWGPRGSVAVDPLEWLSIRAAYGEGYRSPQARLLEDGEEAPFSKVRSADLGVRVASGDRYEVTLAGYRTELSDDIAFDAEAGRLERIGRTRRLGGVLHAQARPVDGAVGAVSITFVDAELTDPPPASAEEPQPPFESDQNLPFVPPLVVRADLGARPVLGRNLAGSNLTGRAGLGFSFLSARPLPYGEFSDPVALVDAATGLGWGPLEFGVEIFNVLNHRYAASEFTFASSWDPDAPRRRAPARHTAAGAPRSWLVTLGVSL